jgi:hypothetical protein
MRPSWKLTPILLGILLAASGVAAGHKDYPLALTVQEESNITSQHPTLHFGFAGGNGGGFFGNGVTKHVFATGSDNNAYDLVPQNRKDVVLPGTYQARFDGRLIHILVDKHELKMSIIEVKPLSAKNP